VIGCCALIGLESVTKRGMQVLGSKLSP
jgi:hypothetical protein